jgi:hypothetical protein
MALDTMTLDVDFDFADYFRRFLELFERHQEAFPAYELDGDYERRRLMGSVSGVPEKRTAELIQLVFGDGTTAPDAVICTRPRSSVGRVDLQPAMLRDAALEMLETAAGTSVRDLEVQTSVITVPVDGASVEFFAAWTRSVLAGCGDLYGDIISFRVHPGAAGDLLLRRVRDWAPIQRDTLEYLDELGIL